eukprot:scaffold362671_cov16-Prasinocladus_malaysianus.AAC.1
MPRVDYSDHWSPSEEVNNLRRVAGTGDFRIGLLQTDGEKCPGKWHAYQVRIYPYLHRNARHHIGASDTSNNSYWYRERPGGDDCLIDDYSQEEDHAGFKKLRHNGELKFGFGPHAPFDEFFDIKIVLKVDPHSHRAKSALTVHKEHIELDEYEHKTRGFDSEFHYIDAIALSYNNMRPYADIEITDLKVEPM